METKTIVIFGAGFLIGVLVTVGLGGIIFSTRMEVERTKAVRALQDAEAQREQAEHERMRINEKASDAGQPRQDPAEEQLQKVEQAFKDPKRTASPDAGKREKP